MGYETELLSILKSAPLYKDKRLRSQDRPFFIGEDVPFFLIEGEGSTTIRGNSIIPNNYFGESYYPEEVLRLVHFVTTGRSYSTRSKLAQAGLSVYFSGFNLTPKNNILVENIPGAKLALFDNAAHIIFQPEPEKVLGTIIEFLK